MPYSQLSVTGNLENDFQLLLLSRILFCPFHWTSLPLPILGFNLANTTMKPALTIVLHDSLQVRLCWFAKVLVPKPRHHFYARCFHVQHSRVLRYLHLLLQCIYSHNKRQHAKPSSDSQKRMNAFPLHTISAAHKYTFPVHCPEDSFEYRTRYPKGPL